MADTSVIFEGILEKKGGGLSKWKKAHYVLTKNKLTAYAKKGASKAKDTYALAGMSVTKVTDRDDNRFTLSLSSGEHLFRCNSDELRTEWITNFHVATSEVLSNPANQGAIASAAAAVATATAPTTPPPTATKPATPPEPELGDPSESSSEAAPRDTGDVEAMVVTTPVPTPEPETPPPVTAARPKKAPPKKPVRRDSRPPKPTPGDAPTPNLRPAAKTPATRPAAATPVTPPQPSPPAEDSLSDDKDDSVSTPAPAASSSGTRGTTGGSSAPRSRTTGATTGGVAAPRVSAGGVPPSRALPAGSDIESLEQAIARACDHKPRMVAAEKVSDDYLKAQSAVPVRLTKFLHAERQFLADVYALDANTTTLVEHYREQSQLLDLVIESIAALSDQVKFGDEGSDLVIREIALRIPMRDKLRNSCITTLMQVVEVLDNKREQYKQRTKALDESLTKLFNAFDATVTNPLFQADAVSSFTGISKTLFELHYTIFESIQEALQEARREDLRAQAMYHTLAHIEEEHYRYSSLLEEHKRVAALSNESNSIWNQLDSNRNEILDAQDDCEELQIKVRKLRRRGGGRGGSESKEELEASLRQKQEHMSRLDEQQERLRNRLKYLYAQGFREVFSIKPDKMDSMAEHLVRTGVEAVRYMDQYLEIDADRFADASNDTSLGLSMSFEGHDCLVLQVPTKADEETSRFVREVLLPLRAPHPNVVAIEAYFYEEDQSCAYIQSTLFHQSLVDWSPQVSLDDPSVKFESLRSIFVGAFHGLAHLHSHAVTHRNLTPSDILIDPTGTPIIHGFGISPDDRDMIALANAKLTAHYIAPEVVEANGDNVPVPSRDVWSLGVILFEKCYGRFPDNPDIEAFDRDSKDTKAFACCRRVLNMDPEARATAAEALLHPFFVEPAAANTPSMAARQAKITTFVEDLEAFRNSVSTGDRATVEFAPATLVDDVIAHFSAINTAEELAAPVTFAYAGDVADCDAGYWDVHPLTKFFEEVVSSRDDVFRSVIRGPYLPVAGNDAAEPAVFEAVGRAMVKCLVDGVVMPLDMAPSFFHFVSGLEIRDLTLEDALLELERYDADIASGLRNTVASKLDEESGVTMASMCGCNDETVVIDGNKVASVIESAQFVLIESRRDRLEALKAAFGLLSAQVPSLLELEAVDLAAMVAGPRAAAKNAFAWGIGGDTEGADALATWWRSAGQYAIKCASFDLAGVVGPKTVAKHKVVNLPVSVHTRDSLGLLLSPNFHILDLPPGGGAGGVAEAMSASQARHIYEPVAATPTPVAPKPARSPKPTSSLPTP